MAWPKLILCGLITGALGSWVAGQKRRSRLEGFWLGFFFSLFGVLLEALLPTQAAKVVAPETRLTADEAARVELLRSESRQTARESAITIGIGLAACAGLLLTVWLLWMLAGWASWLLALIDGEAASLWLRRLGIAYLIDTPIALFAGWLGTTKGRHFNRGLAWGLLAGPLGLLRVVFWEGPAEPQETRQRVAPRPVRERRSRPTSNQVFEAEDLSWLEE